MTCLQPDDQGLLINSLPFTTLAALQPPTTSVYTACSACLFFDYTNAASSDQELLRLKSSLAEQEDIAAAAVGKMRRSDALAQEVQREVVAERETNVQLHKEKATLEKTVKDLQLKLVDLETKGYSSGNRQDVRFLHGRIQEVSLQPKNGSDMPR